MEFFFPFPKMQLHTWNLLPSFKLVFKAHPSQSVKDIHPSFILSISMYGVHTNVILVYREQDGYIHNNGMHPNKEKIYQSFNIRGDISLMPILN